MRIIKGLSDRLILTIKWVSIWKVLSPVPGTKHTIISNNSSNYTSVTDAEKSSLFFITIQFIVSACAPSEWGSPALSLTINDHLSILSSQFAFVKILGRGREGIKKLKQHNCIVGANYRDKFDRFVPQVYLNLWDFFLRHTEASGNSKDEVTKWRKEVS